MRLCGRTGTCHREDPKVVAPPTWKRVTFPGAPISFETLGDAKPGVLPERGFEFFVQEGDGFRFDVYVGRAMDLEWWKEYERVAGDAKLVGPTAVTVCGATAEQLVVEEPARVVEVYDPDNHHEGIAGRTVVALAFRHGEVGAVFLWRVDTDRRDSQRAREQRMFDSIRCR